MPNLNRSFIFRHTFAFSVVLAIVALSQAIFAIASKGDNWNLIGLLIVSAFIEITLFIPSCIVGSITCKIFQIPKNASIPMALPTAAILNFILQWWYIENLTTHPMPGGLDIFKDFFIYLSIPLSIYCWIAEGSGMVCLQKLALFRRFKI
jgi:hypothetical protein